MKVLILFIVLQFINVVLSTIKSIVTVKGTTFQSALTNTIYYALYTIIVIYTIYDFGFGAWDLWIKVLVTAVTNFIGVYLSAWILNKFKQDKVWEIVATIDLDNGLYNVGLAEMMLQEHNISYNVTPTQKLNEYVFHIYSQNQKESLIIKKILKDYQAKYIVHEESVKL